MSDDLFDPKDHKFCDLREERLREAEEHLRRHHTPEPRTDVARQQVMTRLHEAEDRVAELEQEVREEQGRVEQHLQGHACVALEARVAKLEQENERLRGVIAEGKQQRTGKMAVMAEVERLRAALERIASGKHGGHAASYARETLDEVHAG
jgi:uncharacterized protein YceH (UPF0502 family)